MTKKKSNLLVDRFLELGIHVCTPARVWLRKCGYKATKKDFERFWRACQPEWIGWLAKELVRKSVSLPLTAEQSENIFYDLRDRTRRNLQARGVRRKHFHEALRITR